MKDSNGIELVRGNKVMLLNKGSRYFGGKGIILCLIDECNELIMISPDSEPLNLLEETTSLVTKL